MSAATLPTLRRAGSKTRAAAALVLVGLALLAYYAVFSGPTTYRVAPSPRAAPGRTGPRQSEEPEASGGERRD